MTANRNHPKPILLFILAMFFLAISTLACGINLGGTSDQESIQLEQTRVALQQTQIALDSLTQDTTIETEAPPAPDVSYEGISFSFDSSIAAAFSPAIIPGQNLGEDYMPGDTYPTYYEFSVNGYAVGNHFHTPIIKVYPVAEFRSISTMASNIIDDLEWALANHPSGGSSDDLPFLPIWNAAQIFSAKVTYFDFQNGSGVRYLSMYGQ